MQQPQNTDVSARPVRAAFLLFVFILSCARVAGAQECGIASAHALASRAGCEILQSGGNAFDAAVAVAAALAVVEPFSSGLGGGGFFLLHRGSDDLEVFVDARETAPGNATREPFTSERTAKPRRRLPWKARQRPAFRVRRRPSTGFPHATADCPWRGPLLRRSDWRKKGLRPMRAMRRHDVAGSGAQERQQRGADFSRRRQSGGRRLSGQAAATGVALCGASQSRAGAGSTRRCAPAAWSRRCARAADCGNLRIWRTTA